MRHPSPPDADCDALTPRQSPYSPDITATSIVRVLPTPYRRSPESWEHVGAGERRSADRHRRRREPVRDRCRALRCASLQTLQFASQRTSQFGALRIDGVRPLVEQELTFEACRPCFLYRHLCRRDRCTRQICSPSNRLPSCPYSPAASAAFQADEVLYGAFTRFAHAARSYSCNSPPRRSRRFSVIGLRSRPRRR
jgi:hypothetical protein